jgi:hypothetical protein
MTITNFNPNLPNVPVTSVTGDSSSQMTLFYIPKELLCNIFSRLPLSDIESVSLTCRALRHISKDSLTGLFYINKGLAEKISLSFQEITNHRRRFGKFPFHHVFHKCTYLSTLNFSNAPVSHFTVNRILKLAAVAGCAIHQLTLNNCRNIAGPVLLNSCDQLQEIVISGCRSITSLPGLNQQKSLQVFTADTCQKLEGEFDMCEFPQLRSLILTNCIQLTILHGPLQDALLDNLEIYYDVAGEPQHLLIQYWNILPFMGLLDLTALDQLENLQLGLGA